MSETFPRPRAAAPEPEIVTKRRAAATWLAEQGFAIVHIPQGRKAPSGTGWEKRAVTDPGMAGNLIKTERDQFDALPQKGSRLLVIDQDVAGKLEELSVEIPETLRVRDLGQGSRHRLAPASMSTYGWRRASRRRRSRVPGMAERCATPARGRSSDRGAFIPTGCTYEPVDDVRSIGVATRELINALRASKARKRGREDTANGPDDPGWYITNGRHEHLVEKGRWLRGNGLDRRPPARGSRAA